MLLEVINNFDNRNLRVKNNIVPCPQIWMSTCNSKKHVLLWCEISFGSVPVCNFWPHTSLLAKIIQDLSQHGVWYFYQKRPTFLRQKIQPMHFHLLCQMGMLSSKKITKYKWKILFMWAFHAARRSLAFQNISAKQGGRWPVMYISWQTMSKHHLPMFGLKQLR